MNIVHVSYPAPAFAMQPRALSQITDLIVHHTAGAVDQTPLQIDQEHRNEGWAMIGYNFVIAADGSVYDGRPIDVVPSAAYGRNLESIDVVLVGNFQHGDPGYTGAPPQAQIQALNDFSVYIHNSYPGIARTIGHRDVATTFYPQNPGPYATACPGSDLYALLPQVLAYTVAHMPKK